MKIVFNKNLKNQIKRRIEIEEIKHGYKVKAIKKLINTCIDEIKLIEEFECGLCSLCLIISRREIITEFEHGILIHIIRSCQPQKKWNVYYFDPGDIESRIIYLQEILKLYENE